MALLQRTCCPDDPDLMLEQTLCVSALSKELLRGHFGAPWMESRTCDQLECSSITTMQRMRFEVVSHDCDENPTKGSGTLDVSDLVHVFGDRSRRGFHSGDFRWEAEDMIVVGRLSGVTHAGTHHRPVLDCQECESPGFLQGRLCGKVLWTDDPGRRAAQVLANYVIRAEKLEHVVLAEQDGAVGTLEGVVVRGCGCC
jgi:hypothetical protein